MSISVQIKLYESKTSQEPIFVSDTHSADLDETKATRLYVPVQHSAHVRCARILIERSGELQSNVPIGTSIEANVLSRRWMQRDTIAVQPLQTICPCVILDELEPLRFFDWWCASSPEWATIRQKYLGDEHKAMLEESGTEYMERVDCINEHETAKRDEIVRWHDRCLLCYSENHKAPLDKDERAVKLSLELTLRPICDFIPPPLSSSQ